MLPNHASINSIPNGENSQFWDLLSIFVRFLVALSTNNMAKLYTLATPGLNPSQPPWSSRFSRRSLWMGFLKAIEVDSHVDTWLVFEHAEDVIFSIWHIIASYSIIEPVIRIMHIKAVIQTYYINLHHIILMYECRSQKNVHDMSNKNKYSKTKQLWIQRSIVTTICVVQQPLVIALLRSRPPHITVPCAAGNSRMTFQPCHETPLLKALISESTFWLCKPYPSGTNIIRYTNALNIPSRNIWNINKSRNSDVLFEWAFYQTNPKPPFKTFGHCKIHFHLGVTGLKLSHSSVHSTGQEKPSDAAVFLLAFGLPVSYFTCPYRKYIKPEL